MDKATNLRTVLMDCTLSTVYGQVTVRGQASVDVEGIDALGVDEVYDNKDYVNIEGLTIQLNGQPIAEDEKDDFLVFLPGVVPHQIVGTVRDTVCRTAIALAGVQGYEICEESHLGFLTDDLVRTNQGKKVHRRFCISFTPLEGGEPQFVEAETCTSIEYRDARGRIALYVPRPYARGYLRHCSICGCRVLPENYFGESCVFCQQEGADSELTRIRGYTESHNLRAILFDSRRKADALGHFKGDPADFVGLGFELEVDTVDEPESDNQEVADGLADSVGLERDAIRFAHDGSLNWGFECISQPHTVEAFWEKAPQWQGMLKYLADAGYSSHDVGTCGLHVHVSRGMFGKTTEEQDSAIAKVFVFFDENWDALAMASRRRNFAYCEKNRLRWEDCEASYGKKYGKYYAWKKSSKSGNARGHYVALNNANRATFEYRLGRGTLNSWSFFSWVDLCLTLTANAKRITVNKVTSNDLVSWLGGIKESTARYLYKRGAFREAVLALFPSIKWESDLTDC